MPLLILFHPVEARMVIFGRYCVTDSETRQVLERISECLFRHVFLTSGDRDFVPQGSTRASLHNEHRAADFHLAGVNDDLGFHELLARRDIIFGATMNFQLIWHARRTVTGGPHLHIGNAVARPHQRGFWKEGVGQPGGIYLRVV